MNKFNHSDEIIELIFSSVLSFLKEDEKIIDVEQNLDTVFIVTDKEEVYFLTLEKCEIKHERQ